MVLVSTLLCALTLFSSQHPSPPDVIMFTYNFPSTNKHHKGFISSLTQHRITSITNILDAQHSLFNEHTSVELILLQHLGIEHVPHKLFKKLISPLNIQAPVFSPTTQGMITAVKGQRMVSFHSHRCVCAFSESNSKLTVLKNELVGMSYSQLSLLPLFLVGSLCCQAIGVRIQLLTRVGSLLHVMLG